MLPNKNEEKVNVLLYTRVSSDEQALGFSLNHQKEALEKYCAIKGYNVLKCFIEDHSAKNFERPEWKKVLAYVKANKKNIDSILITRWDRFSRSTELAYTVIREFKQWGIEINAIEQPLDLTQPDSKVMLGIYLILPEVENDKISIRTREGLRRAMKEGCCVGSVPFGYIRMRDEQGKATITPHPELSLLVKKVFAEYAKGIYSSEDIRKKYYKKGLKVTKNGFLHMLKNVAYIGKIYIPAWKKEDEQTVEAIHDAIIDSVTFSKVQKLLEGKYRKPKRTNDTIVEQLPLRGFLQCPDCSRILTGSASKGRNAVNSYWYYHCQPPCKARFKISEVHELFNKLLDELSIKEEEVAQYYKKILAETFKEEGGSREVQTQSLKRELGKLQTRLESVEQKFFDDIIDVRTYNEMKNKTDIQIGEIKMELEELKTKGKDFEAHLKKGASFLSGVNTVYGNAPIHLKREIIQSIFTEKLIYTPKYFETSVLDEIVSLILTQKKKLKFLKVKY